MNEIDWIRLWFLNELVSSGSQVVRLLRNPDEQWSAYWSFPGRAVLRASEKTRMDTFLTCVREGLIEIYPDSWLRESRFFPHYPYQTAQFKGDDALVLHDSVAVITLAGYLIWESEFQPDWSRYWMQIEGCSYNELTHEVILSVLYSSNNILDDLIAWLPSYWGLDKEFGLVELGCRTEFQHMATAWKVLSCVKVIEWKAVSGNARYFQRLQTLTAGSPLLGNGDNDECLSLVENELYNKAVRALCQLSKKWDCVGPVAGDCRDGEPKLRNT